MASSSTSHSSSLQHTNRLARATSPYLLQHRHNPVDWFEWGQEAFDEARRRDVPIFLSVGYSTCYWCHVMERESFESEAIAKLMNAHFVCVKVDREERPDVDDVYMSAVQAFTSRGGWPMSVFLEPQTLKPFWAGTYFPAEPKFSNTPPFPQVLTAMSTAWREQRQEVLGQSNELAEAVAERVAESLPPARLGQGQIAAAVQQLVRQLDQVHGGFGSAPKFPQPVFLDLLLSVRGNAGDDQTRAAIDHALRLTLTRMAEGGLFDHVGGGFHRYSVDAKWLVPHFEKMLYDNAALAATYADAFAMYNDPLYARVARRTCEYVLREMRSPEGAFFSAQDAEVDHREGLNYLWTPAEIDETLDAEDAALAKSFYGLNLGPNFQDPHHPHEPASNILFVPPSTMGSAWSKPETLARIDRINAELYAKRQTRRQPGTDDKVIASWNGLMIGGLARCAAVLKETRFLEAAKTAAEFILRSMRTPDGELRRIHAKGTAHTPAFLEDYAMLAWGLLQLHAADASSNDMYLNAARELLARAQGTFKDEHGGYYDTRADQPDLFVRTRSIHDGALSSASSVMLHALIDLAVATRDRAHAHAAARLLRSMSGHVARLPLGCANAVRGLLRLLVIDPSAFHEMQLDLAEAGAGAAAMSDQVPVVEILSEIEELVVPAAEPTGLTLRVRIAEGYHLTAAVPGADNLVPFKVFLAKGSGLNVYVDYPAGQDLASQPGVKVYSGEFDLPVIVERAEGFTGEIGDGCALAVTYQPCSDTACLEAVTVELDLVISPA